jgi:hypothetical protein
MRALAPLLVLWLPAIALAGEVTLSWTPPTQNEDGSPLTDLTSYNLRWNCVTPGPPYTGLETFLAPASSHVITGLPDFGTCYFVAQSVNSQGVASVYSNEASKTMTGLELPGVVENLAVNWTETPPATAIFALPETDFNGTPLVAGNWNVPGQSLQIDFEITPRTFPQSDSRIISKAVGSQENDHYFMVSLFNGALRFRLKTNGSTSTLIGNAQIPLSVTTVGRATYDGSEMVLYVNGSRDAARAKTGDMDSSSAEVWVAGNPPNNYGPFDGLIAVTVQ